MAMQISRSRFSPKFKKLGTRLGAGFGVLILLILTMAGLACVQLWQIHGLNEQMGRHSQRLVLVQEWSALVQFNLERAVMATRLDAAAGDDAATRERVNALMSQLNSDMSETANTTVGLQQKVIELSDEGEVASLVEQINKDRSRFVIVRTQVRDDIQMGDDGVKRIEADLVPLSRSMSASLNKLAGLLSARLAHAGQELKAAVARALWALLACGGTALVAAVVIAWLTTRSITQPIRRAVTVADAIANGDLSQSFDTQREDEIGSMLRRLATMQQNLCADIASIRRAAESIQTASSEVAARNQDLSDRTELAAGCLQSTASSMQSLSGTVRHSADAAGEVDRLALSACTTAERGGHVAREVVANMQAIADSSRRIGDITGVIDGIAFQTNILALNAAVEAARAGEQGRGFAVVASEVRVLALRSATAASEIKTLIATTVERINHGSKLVHDAGATMSEIVASIGRVSGTINQVTSATTMQGDGIGQVDAAVQQLESMTQQNAALVEQSAASAQSLRTEADALAQLVARYKLDEGTALSSSY